MSKTEAGQEIGHTRAEVHRPELSGPAAGSRRSPRAARSVDPRWRAFADRYLREYFEWEPTAAVEAGLHEFDGRLPDWSEDGLRRRTAWLKGVRESAGSFEPTDLSAPEAFERSYLLATVEAQLFWLDRAEWPRRNPAFYVEALDPDLYLTRSYAPAAVRIRALSEYAGGLPEAVGQILANLQAPLPSSYAALGRSAFQGLARFFASEAVGAFPEVTDRSLRAPYETACAAAAKATGELAAWFAGREDAAEEGFALGEARLAEMLLATERIDVSPDRLERMAVEELDRNLEELREACAGFASGARSEECVAAVRAGKPEGGVLAAAGRQVARLERLVRERELVTIPEHPAVEVEESPRYMRWNSAHIRIPGPYDAHLPATYYITPPDPRWTPKERADYVPGRADLLFASAHEVWPGHLLQFLHSHRAPFPLARVFVGYAFAEGWAHYAEEMVWEAGLEPGDPEVHAAKVMNALVRTVRCLVSLRLHAGEIGVGEAERLFRKRAFLDAASARQQAARGTFDPGYLNYTLGKLMIRKLREEWEGGPGAGEAPGTEQGSGAEECPGTGADRTRTSREFHDRLLGLGGPPLPLARQMLLGPTAGPPL
ncbi:MAG: DUF885 family protein [Gemmatimonadota bacterium]